ncbi:spore cortex biosynthesis protein YabQ [Metasolibacillus meyeri]|uniref:spore cortex biosynthesis protein YabQ n=1 Tax=Metasolibacillus meyeri TaxID=1071052 RepID=UPI000D31F2B3|nr:spore cortex biosynthesis protein YabQ [Metasolibacillus meyeri]
MTISAQLMSAVIMLASGIFVGCVIDSTRAIWSGLPRRKWIQQCTVVLELMVWIVLGFCTFYFLYVTKGGQWRAVDPLFQLAGIFLYDKLLRRFFRFIGRLFVLLFIRPIYWIVYIISRFFLIFWRVVRSIVLFVLTPVTKLYKVALGTRFKK